jgi:hypothetical protein
VSTTLRAYRVQIGTRQQPRLSFTAMATDSVRAFDQHVDLAQDGERVEITATDRQPPISVPNPPRKVTS